ncbi:MAG TPA: type II toxin-antitoxin system VapC family toxin [Longimicrobium sp.]
MNNADVYFLDASAVIKAYIPEKGTDTVNAAFRRLHGSLFISDLVAVETMASFAKLWRKEQISTRTYQTARNDFLGDLGTRFFVVPLPRFVYDATLAALHTLRERGVGAADTLHICTAEWLQSLVPGETISFVCSDEKLRRAASSRGFEIFDPETGLIADLELPPS